MNPLALQGAWRKLSTVTEEEVLRAFAPLRGRYVWGVRAGQEAVLTLESGEPRLEVNEQRDRLGEFVREVVPRGRHHLALFDCRFELACHGETEATDEHGRSAVSAAGGRLSGQALERVSWRRGVLRLDFDLGASLRVWRHPQSEPGAVVWQLLGAEPLVFRA